MTAQIQNGGGSPDRGIINEEGVEKRIPLLGWRQSDALFVVALTAGLFLVGIEYEHIWVLTTGVGLLTGLIIIYIKPNSLSIFEAVQVSIEYLFKPSIVRSASKSAPADVRNEGGLLEKTPFRPEERSQDLTNVKLIFPGESAVLREDGGMERLIEIHGESMDFAPAKVWAGRQEVGKELANRVDSDDFSIYLSTQDFSFGEIVDRLEDRMDDPDIKSSPAAWAVLESYYEKRPKKMEEKNLQESVFYLSIVVSRQNVSAGFTDEPTPIEKLVNLPIIGLLVSRFIDLSAHKRGVKSTEREEEIHRKMINKLDDLSRQIEDNYISATDGYTYKRLTSMEMTLLLSHFNNNPDIEQTHIEQLFEEQLDMEANEHQMREGI